MLKQIGLFSIAFSLISSMSSATAGSALIFKKDNPPTVAVNLDWKYREGTAVIHPRNTLMVSTVDNAILHPVIWKNRYGSVVFHAGHKFKAGPGISGMNEKGLAATVLLLNNSSYPSNAETPTLKTSEWVQYVLDNFQSVKEVIDDAGNYQLVAEKYRNVLLNVHLLVADAEGNAAVLEYLDGKLQIHTQSQFNTPVVTNTDYLTSLSLLNDYLVQSGPQPLPGGYDSNSRFIRGAHYIKRLPSFVAKEEHIAYAFNGLSEIAQAPGSNTPTQLSMVFDIPSRTIYFRSINEAAVRVIALDTISFGDMQEPVSLNSYQHLYGDVVPQFKSMIG